MGLKSLFVIMELEPSAQPWPPEKVISHLFGDWLSDFFALKQMVVVSSDEVVARFGAADDEPMLGEQPRWPEEVVDPKEPLTRCPPGRANELIAEASARIATLTLDDFCLLAEGSLRHRARGDDAPRWYGRWFTDSPPVLAELITIRLEWRGRRRSLEISLPHSGYPITSSELCLDAKLSDGLPEVAAANRTSIFSALSRAAASFGLQRSEVRWLDDGDYAGLYPDDAASIRQHWLPQLRR